MAGVSRSAAVIKFVHDKYNTELPKNFELLTYPNDFVIEMLNKAYEVIKLIENNKE